MLFYNYYDFMFKSQKIIHELVLLKLALIYIMFQKLNKLSKNITCLYMKKKINMQII